LKLIGLSLRFLCSNQTNFEVTRNPDAVDRAEYEWPDGRKSYPLLCIFYCPHVVSPTLGTMYASTKTLVMNVLQIMKVFDCRDPEELTTAWLNKKLEFFK